MRRAAATFTFTRPDEQQRRTVLTAALQGTGIYTATLDKLVTITGPSPDRPGYTYSDLTQRLIPAAVLNAFPDRPITDEELLTLAEQTQPSPVFTEDNR
ncbi:hypothetical protein [Streptomyces sp. NPDC014744]|uniref:hypothetical protein n=1 Tax=Streptomyces sp. NPDC014744 TaxID=3364903 RepID=UPI003700D968